jgi:hypothetical protein
VILPCKFSDTSEDCGVLVLQFTDLQLEVRNLSAVDRAGWQLTKRAALYRESEKAEPKLRWRGLPGRLRPYANHLAPVPGS